MAKVCTIYLIRHGMSEANKAKVVSGHTNSPLTPEGKRQAHAAKEALNNVYFHAAYSSDLARAIDTGSIIYGQAIPEHRQLQTLRERYFGGLEGKPNEVMIERDAILSSLPHDEKRHYKHVPDMESDHELVQRFATALKRIARDHMGETILVAAHGSAIRNLLIDLGFATRETLPAQSFGNASYACLTYSDRQLKVDHVVVK